MISHRVLVAIFALLIAVAQTVRADLVITQKVDGSGQTGEVVLKIKGDKLRADLPRDVSSITDLSTGEVVTLMHAQKSYLRIPAERAKEMLKRMQDRVSDGKSAAPEPAKLQATGKNEKVGEWETQIFTTKIGGLDVTYWVAKDFPNYAAVSGQLQKFQQASLGNLSGALGPKAEEFGGMPVKTEMTLGGKKITNTIVSVKEEPVDAAIFELPDSYKEIELPEQKEP
jgi:hypothetical protein